MARYMALTSMPLRESMVMLNKNFGIAEDTAAQVNKIFQNIIKNLKNNI